MLPSAPASASKPINGSGNIQQAQWLKGRVSVLDAIDGLRKLRRQYDDHKLDDVAWDLLLEMLLAEQKHLRLSVSALTVSIRSVSSQSMGRTISLFGLGLMASLATTSRAVGS